MNPQSPNKYTVPDSMREGLERFVTQIRDSLEEQLVSVVLYGSVVKGEYARSSSDVNVMMVLKEVTIEHLEKVASPVRQGVRDFGLTVMVQTENGLLRSADVFPIKFLDIRQHHRVLCGKDVVAELDIKDDHLRLRCEQEIRNLLLRLRHFYLHRAQRDDLIESTLATAISSFLTSLSALLVLETGHAPTEKRAIASAARELGLDDGPLQDTLALKSGEYKPDSETLKRLYGAIMNTVQRAADILERS